MNSIEDKLWDYIDGSCSAVEHAAIGSLIEQDEVYRNKYRELLKLNAEFLAMELDEPPMAFTYNIMESIRAEHAQQPLKAAIDKRIIRGIGLFFVLTISALLLFILSGMNWSASSLSAEVPAGLVPPTVKNFIAGDMMKGFLFLDLVLVLYLLDNYLRKKSLIKTGINVQTSTQQNPQRD